jgi:amidohydrolase
MSITEEVESLKEEVIELRRDFHKHPELGWEEERTAGIVADYLRNCGLEVETGIAKTGVVGLLEGEQDGPTILLRADMDALPIEEMNDVLYKSVNEGVMHACAHDGHTAMLLVAAKILARRRGEIKGNIKFLFQPNEEWAAAKDMIEAGVLEEPAVDAVFGQHLWVPIESGKLGISGGPVMGALDEFKLRIKGKGGHTSSPQEAVDPILAASDVVQSVQRVQTREINALKPTVIMFGKIEGGTTTNVIPEEVELEGTIRYLYKGGDNSEERPKQRFERIVSKVCESHRAEYELEIMPSNAVVDNEPKLAEMVKSVAEESVVDKPEDIVSYTALGGEDFSEFLREVPGVFYFIGARNSEKGADYPHHHPHFNIDEDALTTGVEMHVRSALSYFNNY